MSRQDGVTVRDVAGTIQSRMQSMTCDAFEVYRSGDLEPCGVLLWYPGTQQRFFVMVSAEPPEPQLHAQAAPLPFPRPGA